MTTPQIIAAMCAVRQQTGAVAKTKRNDSQGYQFRGIDDIYNAIHEAMNAYGVLCVPRVVDYQRTERDRMKDGTVVGIYVDVVVQMEYSFVSREDGSSIIAVTRGEAMDTGDKATNKAMAAAHKYALIQTLCLPTSDGDADAESPDAGKRSQHRASTGKRATDKQRVMLRSLADQKGVLPTLLALASEVAGRQIESGADLTSAEASALIDKLQALPAPLTDQDIPL